METPQALKKKMSLGKKILIGAGIVLLIGIIGSELDKNDKTDNASINSNDLPVVAEAKLTDAQKDSIKVANEKDIIDNTISAKALINEYESNEVNADNYFKGKTFFVNGVVTDIKKDIMDDIYVTLDGGGDFREVQCFFEDKVTAGKLKKGMNVTFKGKCDGLMMNVLMRDCELFRVN